MKRKAESQDGQVLKRKRVGASDFKPIDKTLLPGDALLDLPDSEIYYVSDFIDLERAARWYKELYDLEAWYQPTLKMYGRSFLQSRAIVAYGSVESPDAIKYSGTEVPLEKNHPPILREIQTFLQDKLQTNFNHCMLNRYENGTIYIGSHSDNLENLCIASVSLGAVRDFILTHKKKLADVEQPEKRKHRWGLADGSLLIMQGETQRFWKHEIPKQPKIKEGRISLTFRQLTDK